MTLKTLLNSVCIDRIRRVVTKTKKIYFVDSYMGKLRVLSRSFRFN